MDSSEGPVAVWRPVFITSQLVLTSERVRTNAARAVHCKVSDATVSSQVRGLISPVCAARPHPILRMRDRKLPSDPASGSPVNTYWKIEDFEDGNYSLA